MPLPGHIHLDLEVLGLDREHVSAKLPVLADEVPVITGHVQRAHVARRPDADSVPFTFRNSNVSCCATASASGAYGLDCFGTLRVCRWENFPVARTASKTFVVGSRRSIAAPSPGGVHALAHREALVRIEERDHRERGLPGRGGDPGPATDGHLEDGAAVDHHLAIERLERPEPEVAVLAQLRHG